MVRPPASSRRFARWTRSVFASCRGVADVAFEQSCLMARGDAEPHRERHHRFRVERAVVDQLHRAVHADGDVVIVEERMRATLAGGRPYENDYCFVFTVAGDTIRKVREYMDTRKGWRMVFGEEAR